MKIQKYNPFGEMYTLQDVRRDSDRGLAAFRDRLLARLVSRTAEMRKKRIAITGIPVKCVMAAASVLILSVHFV